MKHFQSNAAHSCEISHSSGNLQILVLKNTFHNTNTLNKYLKTKAIYKSYILTKSFRPVLNLDLARGFVLFDAAKIRLLFDMRKRLHKKTLLSVKIKVKYYGFAIFGGQIRSINS